MKILVGMLVDHLDFGPGRVEEVLGTLAVVNFYGEIVECKVGELIVKEEFRPGVKPNGNGSNNNRVEFRRGFEAVNLGVVPPNHSSLLEMSIGGDKVIADVNHWLRNAPDAGVCKVVFGNYGTGKSHYLHLVKSIALQSGWVVSYLEFDPKAVDPAKPHLVYREIMSKLSFPQREDGNAAIGFRGFIKEIRNNWMKIRDLPYLKRNPWFRHALEVLRFYPHNEDSGYISGCNWLAGQPVLITGAGSIRTLARGTNIGPMKIPNMPKIRETGEIYVYHLVVVNEICKALGYKGLLIILDEAEHVRGYSVLRKDRANNFFDLLALSAHRPLAEGTPILNDHGFEFPEFWKSGPHFGLFVGLTEGNIFENSLLSLRDACVFLHSDTDQLTLNPPAKKEYEIWCLNLLSSFREYYPGKSELLANSADRKRIAGVLSDAFDQNRDEDLVIRIWVKLACLVPSVLFSNRANSIDDIVTLIREAVDELAGGSMPWE